MFATVEMLESKNACQPQVEIFKAEWPQGIEITLESVSCAQKLGLSLNWFGAEFFTDKAWEIYRMKNGAAWMERRKSRMPASIDYRIARDMAWIIYQEKLGSPSAWEIYQQAVTEAAAIRDKANAPADITYMETMAVAFCDAAAMTDGKES